MANLWKLRAIKFVNWTTGIRKFLKPISGLGKEQKLKLSKKKVGVLEEIEEGLRRRINRQNWMETKKKLPK